MLNPPLSDTKSMFVLYFPAEIGAICQLFSKHSLLRQDKLIGWSGLTGLSELEIQHVYVNEQNNTISCAFLILCMHIYIYIAMCKFNNNSISFSN